MSRLAWFSCASGVAGDMMLGSLLDAGASLDELRHQLDALGLPGWSLEVELTTFRVVLLGGVIAAGAAGGTGFGGVVRGPGAAGGAGGAAETLCDAVIGAAPFGMRHDLAVHQPADRVGEREAAGEQDFHGGDDVRPLAGALAGRRGGLGLGEEIGGEHGDEG